MTETNADEVNYALQESLKIINQLRDENERLHESIIGLSKAVEIYSGKPIEQAMKELIEMAVESDHPDAEAKPNDPSRKTP